MQTRQPKTTHFLISGADYGDTKSTTHASGIHTISLALLWYGAVIDNKNQKNPAGIIFIDYSRSKGESKKGLE